MNKKTKYTPKYISKLTGVDEKQIRARLRKTIPSYKHEKNEKWYLSKEDATEQISYWNNR